MPDLTTIAVGLPLWFAAGLIGAWVGTGAPLPANLPGRWWSWRTLRKVIGHTTDRAGRLRESASLTDAPTVPIRRMPLIPQPREGEHDDDH